MDDIDSAREKWGVKMKTTPVDTLHKPGTSPEPEGPTLTDFVAMWDDIARTSSQEDAVTHAGEIDTHQNCGGVCMLLKSTDPSDE